ncbi:MAG TPA: PAS domain S-box protein [Terracidiphilus sp.]|nr:PAS domain S-box protein [Terracidiphilus sp.]
MTNTGIIRSVGTVTIDEAGSIHSFDPVSERLFGYAQSEVIGRNVSMLMPEPYRGEHDRYLARYRSGGDPRVIGKGCEAAGQRKDGSVFPVWLAVNEVTLAGQRLFVGSVVDLTEQKRFETQLKQAKEDAEAPAAHGDASPRTFRILLAEDVEGNAVLALLRLREQGHEVEWAKNGREAVAAMETFAPDIVLMDMMMPEMDGLEATRAIRKQESRRGRRTPILALTASVMHEDFERCKSADMDGVEGKPIDFSRLLAQIEKMVPAGAGQMNSVHSVQFDGHWKWNWKPLAAVADHQLALRTWRDGAAYLRALQSFVLCHADDADRVKRSIEENPEDLRPARQLTHALKGVAGNLFLKDVAACVERMDAWLKAGDGESARNEAPALRSALARVAEAVAELTEGAEREPRSPSAYDPEAALQLIKDLRASLEALDPERAEPLVAQLGKILPGADLAAIQREIEAFDFEHASEESEALAGKLGLDLGKE